MNCSKPCKKQGRYKKFLHPGAKFEVPKSTVSRHRLASVAVSKDSFNHAHAHSLACSTYSSLTLFLFSHKQVCPAAENQAGTSRPDGETTRTADAIAPTQGYARIDALLLNENVRMYALSADFLLDLDVLNVSYFALSNLNLVIQGYIVNNFAKSCARPACDTRTSCSRCLKYRPLAACAAHELQAHGSKSLADHTTR